MFKTHTWTTTHCLETSVKSYIEPADAGQTSREKYSEEVGMILVDEEDTKNVKMRRPVHSLDSDVTSFVRVRSNSIFRQTKPTSPKRLGRERSETTRGPREREFRKSPVHNINTLK